MRKKNTLFLTCIDKCLSYIDISLQWIERNRNHSPTILPVDNKNTFGPSYPATYIWEGTVSDLIEFAIAIHKARLIRKPSGELITYAEIVRALEQLFRIKIPNIYSRRTRAMERKKNPSPFLERMIALYKQEIESLYV